MSFSLKVRRAREQDRQAVFSFTKKTWEWGDYIPSVWETWLKHGDTLVAAYDDEPIAIVHLQYNGTQSWLEGLRVSDKFRRKEIGTKLVQESINQLTRRKKSIVRLTVDLQNIPSLKLFSKLGFRENFRFYSLEKDTLSQTSTKAVVATKQHISEAWKFVKKSKELNLSKGLYSNWWRWWQLTNEELEKYVKNEQCLLHFKANQIDGLLLFQRNKSISGGESCQICFTSGSRTAVTDMMGRLAEIQRVPPKYFFALVPQNSKNAEFLQSMNFGARWRFALMALSLAPTQHP